MAETWQGNLDARRVRNLIFGLLIFLAIFVGFTNASASRDQQLSGAGLYTLRVVIIVSYLAAVIFTRLKVTINENETKVSFGWGWPSRRIKHEKVASVSVINVSPMQWGGWGYRWVPWKRGSAAVLRKGEGLKFDLKNGRHFVVTIDDANAALAVLKSRITA